MLCDCVFTAGCRLRRAADGELCGRQSGKQQERAGVPGPRRRIGGFGIRAGPAAALQRCRRKRLPKIHCGYAWISITYLPGSSATPRSAWTAFSSLRRKRAARRTLRSNTSRLPAPSGNQAGKPARGADVRRRPGSVHSGRDAYGLGALFPMIEISMRSGVFLPLDTYIENAQFMEWDKLTPKVMEAGRTEEGQLVVPMAYTMPLTFYRKSEVSHTPSTEMTWDDMMADETGILRNAASTAYLEDGRLHGMDGDLQAFSGIAPLLSGRSGRLRRKDALVFRGRAAAAGRRGIFAPLRNLGRGVGRSAGKPEGIYASGL